MSEEPKPTGNSPPDSSPPDSSPAELDTRDVAGASEPADSDSEVMPLDAPADVADAASTDEVATDEVATDEVATDEVATDSDSGEVADEADATLPDGQSPETPAAKFSDPSEMSVDHLTQAFASLMGDPVTTPSDADANALTTHADVADEGVDIPHAPDGDFTPNEASADQRVAREPAADDSISEIAVDDDEPPPTPESIIEAILFVGHPENIAISARLMASYLRGVSPAEVDELIAKINEQYVQQNAPYEIVSAGAGYHMGLRNEFSRVRDAFYGRVREAKLSQAAVDLLAIVAYRQPIARDEIDKLRGQPSGGVLGQLVRRQLLKIEYTEKKPRKKLYSTTDRFLDLFGLESLEDLPSQG